MMHDTVQWIQERYTLCYESYYVIKDKGNSQVHTVAVSYDIRMSYGRQLEMEIDIV